MILLVFTFIHSYYTLVPNNRQTVCSDDCFIYTIMYSYYRKKIPKMFCHVSCYNKNKIF